MQDLQSNPNDRYYREFVLTCFTQNPIGSYCDDVTPIQVSAYVEDKEAMLAVM